MGKHKRTRLSLLHQMTKLVAAKGTGQAKKVNRFKHTGFATAIITIQNIDSAEPICSNIGQVTDVLDTELFEGHREIQTGGRKPPENGHMRIGMTT
ncbi:hypothetical protein MnBA_28990 [Marinobacterium sp. BA1]